MEGFWQPMPSSGGQGSSWYRHEKSDNSKYSRADRFLEDVDPGYRNCERLGPAFWRRHSSCARSSLAVLRRFCGTGDLIGIRLPQSFEEHRNKQLAEELKTVARKTGLSARDQTHLRTGVSAFQEICKLAQEIPADLIVLPTHGYTGLKHVFLGSTAERVVQHAPCPVFVVRQLGKRPGRKKSLATRRFSSRWISPIARGKVSSMPSDSRMN